MQQHQLDPHKDSSHKPTAADVQSAQTQGAATSSTSTATQIPNKALHLPGTITASLSTSFDAPVTSAFESATMPAKELQTLLGVPTQMELSQIELIYRAEGNANLVLALPQFKKVLRLPKMLPQRLQQKDEGEGGGRAEGKLQPEAEQSGDNLTMETFVAYIEIIRKLLGRTYIFETDIVMIPKDNDRKWLNAHISAARPAHRLDKEFCGQFGLLLPDATQLPTVFDFLLSNTQPKAKLTGDTYAIEIKPKQGWLLVPRDVNDLFDIKPKEKATIPTTTTTITTTEEGKPTTDSIISVAGPTVAKMAKTDTRCRYCAMQFLKLQNRKVTKRSAYCPIELFSGTPSRMFAALQALLECPQNNLRIFRNGSLIYGDHKDSMSWHELKEGIFNGDKLEIVKHLLVTCLLRDFVGEGETVVDVPDVVVKPVVGLPQTSATPTAKAGEIEAHEEEEEEAKGTSTSRKTTTTTEIKTLTAKATTTQPKVKENVTEVTEEIKVATITATKASGATPAGAEEEAEAEAVASTTQSNQAELLCLPKNCVLQKTLHLQLLAKHNLQYMLSAGYASQEKKTYNILASLLRKSTDITFEKLSAAEAYLLGATALDCSIMITFQEVASGERLSNFLPHLIQMPEYRKSFMAKVTLLDLDPKPDNHFSKYVRQTKKAYELIQYT